MNDVTMLLPGQGAIRIRKDGKLDMRYKESKRIKILEGGKGIVNTDTHRVTYKKKNPSKVSYWLLIISLALILAGFIKDKLNGPKIIHGTSMFGTTTVYAKPQEPTRLSPAVIEDVEEDVPHYCDDPVEATICSYDWDDELMVAIAKRENGYAMNGYKWNPKILVQEWDGSFSTGIMQINSVHGYSYEDLSNAEFNINVAYKIWSQSGYYPWGGFTDGGYKEYLQGGRYFNE